MALSRDCADPSVGVSNSRAMRSGESALGNALGLFGARRPAQGLWGKPRCLTSQLKKPRQPESMYAMVRPEIPRECSCDTVRRMCCACSLFRDTPSFKAKSSSTARR